jgi:hypothetical protein
MSTLGMSVVSVSFNGTYAGVGVVFEYTDASGIWFSDTCVPGNQSIQVTSLTLSTNASYALDCGVYGTTNFRVRSTAYTSGTANVTLTASAASIEPAPTVAGIVTDNAGNAIGSTSGGLNNYIVNTPNVVLNDSKGVEKGTNSNPVIVYIPVPLNPQVQNVNILGALGQKLGTAQNPVQVAQAVPAPSFDPCSGQKVPFPISQSSSTQISLSLGGTWHLCSMLLVSTTAQSISLVSGIGSTCGSSTIAIVGATTAANGMPPAANGGWTYGNGQGTVGQDLTFGNNLCLLQSGSGLIAGNLMMAIGKPPYF